MTLGKHTSSASERHKLAQRKVGAPLRQGCVGRVVTMHKNAHTSESDGTLTPLLSGNVEGTCLQQSQSNSMQTGHNLVQRARAGGPISLDTAFGPFTEIWGLEWMQNPAHDLTWNVGECLMPPKPNSARKLRREEKEANGRSRMAKPKLKVRTVTADDRRRGEFPGCRL